MSDILTVREAVARAKSDGLLVSEGALRRWIRSGELPVRWAGNKALVFYPGLVRFIRCESSEGDDHPATMAETPGIRRMDVVMR